MKIAQISQSLATRADAVRQERLLFRAMGTIYAKAEPLLYALLRFVFGVVMLTTGFPKHWAHRMAPWPTLWLAPST